MPEKQRPRLIERVRPAQTREEARQRRSQTMVTFGTLALLLGVLLLASADAADRVVLPAVVALIGAVLLVGGLVLRR